jgi:fatty-acyl-CoA synthase
VGVPDEMLGELVVACIVLQDGAQLDAAAVCSFVKQQLASYKVPRRVLFFSEGEFTVTGNAKIKARDVRKLAVERLMGKDP